LYITKTPTHYRDSNPGPLVLQSGPQNTRSAGRHFETLISFFCERQAYKIISRPYNIRYQVGTFPKQLMLPDRPRHTLFFLNIQEVVAKKHVTESDLCIK
jgi:hypothetical protein